MPPQFTPEFIDFFWSQVDRSGGPDACWPFNGSRNKKGYGRITSNGRTVEAHRVAYALANGDYPKANGLHSCDNRPCCNPRHISDGTQAQNVAEMIERGRKRVVRGEHHGNAKLTEERVLLIWQLRSQGRTYREIADAVGVGQGAIGHVLQRRMWRHVVPPVSSEQVAEACKDNVRRYRLKGQDHPRAKITEEDVRAIRTSYSPRYGEMRRLGKIYGVSDSTIGNIVTRRTWRHVS